MTDLWMLLNNQAVLLRSFPKPLVVPVPVTAHILNAFEVTPMMYTLMGEGGDYGSNISCG